MIDSQQFNQQLSEANLDMTKPFVFYGQTQFLSEESAQSLVEYAREHGYPNREIYHINNKSKFQGILNDIQSPSLFDPQKIIELRFDTEKPSKKIGEQLVSLLNVKSHNLIVIQASIVDYKAQKEKWFKSLLSLSTAIVSKPIYPNQLPNWVNQRAQYFELQLESDALKKIVEYSEGNLLWTNQILLQLKNSHYPRPIKVDIIESMLTDLSVFKIDDLLNALANKQPRAIKIIHKLQHENESLVCINSALYRDFANLEKILNSGEPLQQAFKTFGIWSSKQKLYSSFLQHYQLAQITETIKYISLLDKINKGQHNGDGWLLLLKIATHLLHVQAK